MLERGSATSTRTRHDWKETVHLTYETRPKNEDDRFLRPTE